jgi:hypothetical protein
MVLTATIALCHVAMGQVPAGPVTLKEQGWTVSADVEKTVLTVRHERTGSLLEDVQLRLRGPKGLVRAGKWSVSTTPHRLSIITEDPHTQWIIEPTRDTLKISSTSGDAGVNARVPAAKDRLVARLLEKDGVPVVWTGTDEVAGSYGGSCTRNPSALPALNPECAYFTMGPVSGSVFHSLFDRLTDTAIRFTDQTVMQRADDDARSLRLTMPVPGEALVRLIPDYYTRQLGLPFYAPMDDSHFRAAPMVWSSWTSYYDSVGEADIVRNTDWIADHLKPYGFQYVQLDDGYDAGGRHGHNWIDQWNAKKFPHGPQWLAGYIKSKGLHPGIWIVPNAYGGGVDEHPDWYLRDKSGKFVLDYGTPALDSTNPQVQTFLKKMFTTLGKWGFEYYKFDGEHALPKYAPPVDRNKLFDPSLDAVTAYRDRLKLIRDAIGPKAFVEGCPSGTPLNGIGYINSYFNGTDVYNNWNGMHALVDSINANAFLNHVAVYVMPGEGMELGPRMTVDEANRVRPRIVVDTARQREEPMIGFGVTTAEARTLVSFTSLTGVAYSLASVLPELPDDRIRLIRQTLPTMPILPADLFSRGSVVQWATFKHHHADDHFHNFPEVLDLKINAVAGVYDVVGLVNWRQTKVKEQVSFSQKLGLDPATPYVVFDYWNQRPLGIFKDRMEVQIEPHDTRVLHIHPWLGRPQLIGISRHITGAYSVLDLKWDTVKNALRGSSQTVPGDAYTLYVNVPDGLTVAKAEATVAGVGAVPARQGWAGRCLMIRLAGRQEPIEWQVTFASAAR